MATWERWKNIEMARSKRWEGSEVARWQRWKNSEMARSKRWESSNVARWEVPGLIQLKGGAG